MQPITQFNQDTINRLLAPHEPPCISIYMPTSRYHNQISGNPIAFRNQLKRAEDELRGSYRTRDVRLILEPLQRLLDDRQYWNHQLDGLAAFRSGDLFAALRLPRNVPQLVVVADTFHTKPLVRILQTAGRFQVLCVSQRNVSLYEGERSQIEEVQLGDDVPHNIGEANLFDIDNGHVFRLPEATAVKHGKAGDPNEKQDIVPLDRYFRMIDIVITENYSRRSGLPLVLCALEQYHALFHKLSRNPALLEQGIKLNPDGIGVDRLREEAWKIIEPFYHERTRRLIDDFHVARARQAAGEDIAQVAQAAVLGRVEALLVDADRQVAGRIDPSGAVQFKPLADPDTGDLLDDTAERVLQTGGHVMVVPHELMPTDTGVAAIYRY